MVHNNALFEPRSTAYEFPIHLVSIRSILTIGYLLSGLSLYIPTRRDIRFTPKSDFGLVLSDHLNPQAAGPGVDIIFVHGLGSNPDTTWSAKNQSYICELSNRAGDDRCDPLAGKERVKWVTDFFHHDIPPHLRTKTRAFFYNYDSYWMRDAIEERRETIGKELFEQVVGMATKVIYSSLRISGTSPCQHRSTDAGYHIHGHTSSWIRRVKGRSHNSSNAWFLQTPF
ncbi:hypothetical protein F5B19DRAFT_12548 [Rostrohypoxylon terebratum]|nr:hypothetical protein F5B19DRAFT_12548 [Rostrohypoxylon terebratum]